MMHCKLAIVLVLMAAGACRGGVLSSGWPLEISGWDVPHVSTEWVKPIIVKSHGWEEPIKVIKIKSDGWHAPVSKGWSKGWDEPIKIIKIESGGWSAPSGWEGW